MNQVIYSLCHKPVIGVALWITSLCAIPPLINFQEVNLQSKGLVLEKEFHTFMDTEVLYSVVLDVSQEKILNASQEKSVFIGNNYTSICQNAELGEDIRDGLEKLPASNRKELGEIIPFRIIIKDKKTKSITLDKTFYSICISSHNSDSVKRRIAAFQIEKKGDYTIDVYLEEPQVGLQSKRTSLGLFFGAGGK